MLATLRAVPAVLIAGLLATASVAQDKNPPKNPPKPESSPARPAPPVDGPRRDPEAVKRLADFDALMYLPRAEGLKDLAFSVKLPLGIFLDLKWRTPTDVAWAPRIPDDVKEDHAKKLRITLLSPAFRADVGAQAPGFVGNVVGERESERYAEDGLEVAGLRQVRIVAASEATRSVMKEALATFDEQGRLSHLAVTSPVGAVSELEPVYEAHGAKFVVKETKVTMPGPAGKQVITTSNEYADVGAFRLLRRVTQKNGPMGDLTLEFSDHKPNAGLKDEDFKR